MLTDRYTQAVEYARIAHARQVRKGSGIPYMSHLLGVSSLVLDYGGDEDQAIAGLLHDVIEDCGAEHEVIVRARFGDAVAQIVVACTDGTAEDKARPSDPEAKRRHWWIRKLTYLDRLRGKPIETLLVSGCDKLHNARAIVTDLEDPSVGAAVFDRFTGGRDGTLRYYHSLAALLLRKNVAVARSLENVVARMHELAGASERIELDHGVYRIKVYDNSHYMDEDEAYVKPGWYFSADEAIAEAKRMVAQSVVEAPDNECSQQGILSHYKMFGEDPSVIGSPSVEFSAWKYAEEVAARMADGKP